MENVAFLNEMAPANVESPRPQNFTFRSVEQNTQNRPRPYFSEAVTQAPNLSSGFAQEDWNPSFGSNGPIGLNPVVNNNTNINGFDTEMSDPNNNSSNSAHLTPQSSSSYNRSSSNASFTPPGEDQVTGQASSIPIIAGTYTSFTSVFTSPVENMYSVQPPASGTATDSAMSPNNGVSNQQDDPFKIPAGWDLGPGATPGILNGMTPEGGWEKMMESWDHGG